MFLLALARENLRNWQARPVAAATAAGPQPYSYRDLHRRIVAVEPPGPALENGPFRRLAGAIARYDIFPLRLARPVLQAPVRVGEVVGLRYYLLPGLHIFFCSRVYEVFDGPYRSGFSYETLQGHPEAGQETFAVTKDAQSGAVTVSLQAWSHLAPPWPRWLSPLTRPLQVGAGRAALDHLEGLVSEMS